MRSAKLFFFRRPAVSIATNVCPSISKRTSTASRVVPAISETITRSSPASAFTSVLLPELRLPMMAMCISPAALDRSSLASPASQSSCPGNAATASYNASMKSRRK